MAFHETRLPIEIERGAIGGPGFKTTVTPLGSGFEQRNIEWSAIRGEWDIGYGLIDRDTNVFISEASIDALLNFFYAREGRAHGFRFRDWMDFTVGDSDNPTTDNQSIGTGDAAKLTFQTFKRYSSGGIDYDRTLTKLVSGKVVVLLDNVVQADPGDYSVNLNTGLITFVSAPGAGVDVQIALEFDVPVRFDTDQMAMALEFFETGSWPNIPLVEVRIV